MTHTMAADQSFRLDRPVIEDGVELWRIASESEVLDVNSRYAYLLWCRDFATTTIVARAEVGLVGFITGFRRPEEPGTLLIWQVAVDAAARGQGLAGRMLDALYDRVEGLDHLETTVTPDNKASIALFLGFAERRGARVRNEELFGADLLGGAHEPEHVYRIGPIPAPVRRP